MGSSSHSHFNFAKDDDPLFESYFANFFDNHDIHGQHFVKKKKKREFIERNREEGHNRLWNDYFSESPTYPPHVFRRRFRMNKPLFLRIVDRLTAEDPYFRQRRDATGRLGLSPIQKCTAAIRLLAYGGGCDTVDEYVRLGETTARKCLQHFVSGVVNFFGDEYLRRPTPEDLQRLLYVAEERGFPGMVGSIDCMHWVWKNCPTAWKGMYTRGSGKPTIVLEAVASYDLWIWHAFFGSPDGIYPKWPTFIQSIPLPQTPKASLFADRQESYRKDVERAFGVLQARFAVIKNPCLLWDKDQVGLIMRACIILHNMIVENERDGYSQAEVSDFPQAEGVDLSYSINMNSNISNVLNGQIIIRDREVHDQLKLDLIEHLWTKFGY
ncbi:PREDICTED: uncharacterized protein LOC104770160 [Camelina sativa]|uniref:Uncharacterized protein LOC104732708 n=2 Tax=Camelina sativa TaxID=90675 RepID=A0ABM0XYI2_CAMSA|nr:PREDICTED: uncharacterized protein LOC104732708 [Camelina sativa]XP_010465950.1 PREDICTED: uncharacterized protein LOC104746220 [Camelina sativa]XP_010492833.1 PREDICTED: uncharacterized protein LOC104770160 [Camelina sativa]